MNGRGNHHKMSKSCQLVSCYDLARFIVFWQIMKIDPANEVGISQQFCFLTVIPLLLSFSSCLRTVFCDFPTFQHLCPCFFPVTLPSFFLTPSCSHDFLHPWDTSHNFPLPFPPKSHPSFAMASPCSGLYARPADAAQSEQWGATFHGFLPRVSWENHRTTLW